MAEQKILLAVFAHPDDESFGTGGTLAYYAQQGVDVYLVCGTRGEVGEVAAQFLEGFNSIAERRESELRCAAGILGLKGVRFLDYRDSGMPGSPDNQHPEALAAAPLEQVAAKIASQIRQIQPQVVLTFDPIGGYKHPDHIAIQRATLQAFSLAADPSFEDGLAPFQARKLFYHVIPKTMLRWLVRLLRLFGWDARHFGRNRDIDLQSLVEEGNFPVHAEVDIRSVREQKAAASACHASQEGGMPRRGLLSLLMRWLDRKELFMQAIPDRQGKSREKDLFAGL
ncbi:MAG: PIG-L family deacetylase [Anaerolineales bacterium]|jgi:LmbE family N-acetylglucosaminyl deacetylase|nr:PIG-L family deacetylase [Anaerolineales bacterium]